MKLSPELLEGKTVKQVIAIAGDGKLADGNATSNEFREFLSEVASKQLAIYADECLKNSFADSGLVLQDVVNEVGRRLGFSVVNGKYRGKHGSIGNDGLWELPNKQKIIVEVKTTDAFRTNLDVVAEYRKKLIQQGHVSEELSSILLVVGREDTGDLEAQVRGSRHGWEMRIISIPALLRLMTLKESIDDPDVLRQIYEILIPREFTKLDDIVELIFSTAEDVKKVEELPEDHETSADTTEPHAPKFTPVAFNELVAQRVSEWLKIQLLKRTRALFSSSDDKTRVVCAVSRQYSGKAQQNYWFAFHPYQKKTLESAEQGYVAFGCGSEKNTILIPILVFASWLDGMNITERENRYYWHVQIFEDGSNPVLVRKKGQPRIDLGKYKLP